MGNIAFLGWLGQSPRLDEQRGGLNELLRFSNSRNLWYCTKLFKINTSLPGTWIKKGAQRARLQGNKKQWVICTSGKAKMEKNFEAFSFEAVSLHYEEGRGALSHSHYCLICTCRWTFRENKSLFHINPTWSKHKTRWGQRKNSWCNCLYPHGYLLWPRRGKKNSFPTSLWKNTYRLLFLIIWTVKVSNESHTTDLWLLLLQ